jgi:hypothetical protein
MVHSSAPFGEAGNAIVDIYGTSDNGKTSEYRNDIQQYQATRQTITLCFIKISYWQFTFFSICL